MPRSFAHCRLALAIGMAGAPPIRASQPTTQPPGSRPSRVFQIKTLILPDGRPRKYALFIPPQYDRAPDHRWPLILFLHGSGQCGRDGIKQTRIGLPAAIARRPDRFPFITVMPQAHTPWFHGPDAASVWKSLEVVIEEYRVDRDRIYITGLSMGGFATWEFAILRPDIFAAAVPVCGMGDESLVANISHLPVWAFHGRLDKNVPVRGSRAPVAKLRRLGADPKYTEYPRLGHKCWDEAYGGQRLYRWLLEQRRPPPPRVIDYTMSGPTARVWWLTVWAEAQRNNPAHVRAEVTDDNRVTLRSDGVVAWSIVSDGPPIAPGEMIEVIWNGNTLFKGEFTGVIGYRPSPPATQPQPTSRPPDGSSPPAPSR